MNETKPKIKLLHFTPLWVCAVAIRTCYDMVDKSDNGGEKDKALIYKVGNKNKHSSTLEHLNYTFHIEDVSRVYLQENSRHRHASPSVKSSRFTLKELKEEKPFIGKSWFCKDKYFINRASKYIVLTDDEEVNEMSIKALENLRILIAKKKKNDKAKYSMPDAYKTKLTWTINARSLQNLFGLRAATGVLWEFQNIALELFNQLPDDHKYLFEEFINLPLE